MKKLLLIFILTFLTGCSTMKDRFCDYENVAREAKPLQIDPKLLEPCLKAKLPEVPLTYEGILINTKDNALILVDCSNKLDATITVIKKFANIH